MNPDPDAPAAAPPETQPSTRRQHIAAAAGPALGIALFLLATLVLRHEFKTYHLDDVLAHLALIPVGQLGGAVALTVLAYFVLTGYDTLAFRYVGNTLAYRRIALSSFVAYVFSHNIGLSFFGSGAVRYRMLSTWNVKVDDIARVIIFTGMTFWIGFFFLGGVLHTVWPMPISLTGIPIENSRPIGLVLAGVVAGYLALVALRHKPIVVHGFRVQLPDARTTGAQIALSSVDWLIAAAVLFAVLPSAPGLSFHVVVGAFLLAQVTGLASHVPGGLGVFEGAMVVLLRPWLPGDAVLASVLAYRLVYYLMPMALAIVLFGGYEIRQRRLASRPSRVPTGPAVPTVPTGQSWIPELIPHVFFLTTFIAGAILVLSGATPELPERVAWLRRTLPVPLIEISKLSASIVGVLLLILSNALRERVDAGYFAALALFSAGAAASLAKGLDWEEAGILAAMALALLPCRAAFYRKSSLIDQPLTRGWWIAVTVVAAASLGALDLAYRHVEYAHELWWQFGADAQAPRSLRAMLVAGIVLASFAGMRLLRPAPPSVAAPTPDELAHVQAIAARAPRTTGYLALLGDKELLFHEAGNSFLMYGVSGRTWVAMGDPVGPESDQKDLAWQFRDLADRHGARAVFYEVSSEALPIYLDLGMDLRKLGEEGRVPLPTFSLDGSHRKGLRQTCNRMAREDCVFEFIPAAGVATILDELEAISNAWLADKNTREKQFSLGFFDRNYLVRLPVAVVRKSGRIVAFANVWTGEAKNELTIDLMRYDAKAPSGVMEFLFTQLMIWGREEGYQYFCLGMAPLSGFANHRLAPLWNRFGALLFRHGEHFYNFQGLRSFKDKFDPEWEPRYLASPSGLTTPLVLSQIATLVAGGVKGIVDR